MKLLGISLVLLLVSLSVPVGFLTAFSTSNTFTQTSSFIIFVNGTNYEAENGTSGAITYSGTSATTVVNNAISGFSNGGTIVFKAGTFPVNIVVTKSNITFLGQGDSTILKRDGNNNIFTINGNSHQIGGIVIKDMKIIGDPSYYTTDCIYAKQTHLLMLDKLTIAGCYGNGVYFEEVWDSRIMNSYITYSGNLALQKAALYIYSGTSDSSNNIYVFNSDFETQQGIDVISKGINLGNSGNHMINFVLDKFESHSNLVPTHLNFTYTKSSSISDSYFDDASIDNIYFDKTSMDIKITNNFIVTNLTPVQTQNHIDVEGKNAVIIGNTFEGGGSSDIKVGSSATGTQIIGNQHHLSQGQVSISGTISNIKTLIDNSVGWQNDYFSVNDTTGVTTINSLTLKGAENANSNQINSLAVPTHSTDAQNANHLGLLGNLVVTPCADNQILKWQASNSTWICASNLPSTHFLVGQWDTEKTLINIGTIFSDVYTTPNSNGHAIQIDTNGFTRVMYQVIWNKSSMDVGTDTCQLTDPTNAANVLITTSALVNGINTSSDVSIPAGLQNIIHNYKWQCKSTTGIDNPSWLGGRVWIKP